MGQRLVGSSLDDAIAAFGRIYGEPAKPLEGMLHRVASDLVSATDERTRKTTFINGFRALVEAVVGVDMVLNTPHKRLAFRLRLICFFISLLLTVRECHENALLKTEVRALRRAEREQAETIALLTEAVRQLEEPLRDKSATASVILRVTQRARIREGPSGAARGIGRVVPGQLLRLVSTVDRWYYVEVIDEEQTPTGGYGWIYRRSVNIQPARTIPES
jgi:hypothetical protein